MWGLVLDRILARVDAERAHAAGTALLRTAPLPRGALRPDPCLRIRTLGLDLPTPLGVAAGFDKGGTAAAALVRLGFGFVEAGTVTALPQPGNERPRVFRLPEQRALRNRMGFPNPGAAVVAARLARRPQGVVAGVNVGRSKHADDAVADYRAALSAVAPVADYLVLNVSSPNTPGLRELQAGERLEELVAGTRDLAVRDGRPVPLLVKIGPDLDGAGLDAVCDVALRLGLDGIVAVNTIPTPAGGISGAPLRERALEVLRHLRRRTAGRVVLVSAGGVASADDAWARILAGASLVQAYTGFVYGGPLWPARLNRELARRVRAAGAATVGELVGAAAAPPEPLPQRATAVAAAAESVHRGVEAVEKPLLMLENRSN
jgi:dihydroorotate dehydrogenase